MKKLYKYLTKHFPNSAIAVQYEIVSYDTKERYKAYIAEDYILGKFNWSPEFTTLKELTEYCKGKVELYLSKQSKSK